MLAEGTTVAGYRIVATLGQGGMGVVYEATQLSLMRTVALKLLAAHLSEDVTFRERFRREGQIQAAIDHPNIITVYEAGESEHGLFMAMRLVRGPTLRELILAGELDAGRTMRILRPVADALGTAHRAGLIHRDVKPQNVMVGARDHPFLADFGLTKGPTEASLTRTGQVVGTLHYISPEQIKGERATVRSDVYALTAVLYECLTGVVPFPVESEAALLYAHISGPPPRITEVRPELPGGLDDVIAWGMAKDPAQRYGSALELIDKAERALAGTGADARPDQRGAEAYVETRTAAPETPATVGDAGAQTRAAAGPAGETRPAPDGGMVTRPEPPPAPPAPAGPPAPAAGPPAPRVGRPKRRVALPVLAGLILAAAAAAGLVLVLGGEGGSGTASAETVEYEASTDLGSDPFTSPTDIRGEQAVRIPSEGAGSSESTSSDLVCDRELLISSLNAEPERLRAWARVRDVTQTQAGVARYIRGLVPVTVIRDVRVTDHSFSGRAEGYQAILAAGTAVLSDADGRPVARCRSGNPLTAEEFVPEAGCLKCPPNYRAPPPCETFRDCYRRYPDPPPVRSRA